MAPYEALYGRKCKSPIGRFDIGETKLLGPKLVQQAVEKVKLIQERLRIAQSRQKSYSDSRRRDLEFVVGDWVFLKVSSMKGVMRFGKKGKLSPRYIGPYQIVQRIGRVAYKLDLPLELDAIHPIFHVSMLRKFLGDPSCISSIEDIQVTKDLSYKKYLLPFLTVKSEIIPKALKVSETVYNSIEKVKLDVGWSFMVELWTKKKKEQQPWRRLVGCVAWFQWQMGARLWWSDDGKEEMDGEGGLVDAAVLLLVNGGPRRRGDVLVDSG
uniref:Uncharacterized protein LOC104242086 n=1 Tax=Nicotiana sylvestris TaxID=4096 RepID=A0A1U7XTL5_NICSY|nr:PREDICTED: uncharacterized protein LOC104242086 [Nicotiana sylvestris]